MNTVTMNLEDYSALLLENALLKRMLLIKPTYNDDGLVLEVNLAIAADVVQKMFEGHPRHNEYDFSDPGAWYSSNVTIATRKINLCIGPGTDDA